MANVLETHADLNLPESAPSLEYSIKEIGRFVNEPSHLDDAELPGLDRLVDDWFNNEVNVSEEEFLCRILAVFKDSTHKEVYHHVVDKFSPSQQDIINAFASGNIAAEDATEVLVPQETSVETAQTKLPDKELHVQFSSLQQAKPVRTNIRGYEDMEFESWGHTVKQTPAITFYPENTAEIQTIVKEAVRSRRGIRVSGSRHSWSPVFGRDQKKDQKNNGDVLISTLTERNADVLENFTSLPSSPFQPKQTELNHISEVDATFVNGPDLNHGKKYVRVGTSTTNEEFRRWCIDEGNVTLPLNISEVAITMGGSNATICHGAGVGQPTLSDLVRCIEYVDVNAELRTLTMAESDLLRAASGCFGLIGVVTHISLECDAMSTAVMRPIKLPAVEAIPPPPELKDSDIPEPLRSKKPRAPKEKEKAQEHFERRANNDYYAEWCWFPYSSLVYVNMWTTDSSTEDVIEYPGRTKSVLQVFRTIAMNIAQNVVSKINALQSRPLKQTAFFSWLAMQSLEERREDEQPIRTQLPNALHFPGGAPNIRLRVLEVELPIHAKRGTTSERDYSNVEMRIMGSSNATMAPQRGYELGTCAIEILTVEAAADIFKPYAQQLLNKWTSYRDNDGREIIIRPHWAKEWDQLEAVGRPWRKKLKNESYKAEIAEFKMLLASIGKKHD